MKFRLPTIEEVRDLPEDDKVYPFSNGTQSMRWDSNNCDLCKRAYFPKDGSWPNEKTLRNYMNMGKYCPIQYYLHLSVLFGWMPDEVAISAGWDGNQAPQSCRFFSDDDNDRFKYPKKPKPVPSNQLEFNFSPKKVFI